MVTDIDQRSAGTAAKELGGASRLGAGGGRPPALGLPDAARRDVAAMGIGVGQGISVLLGSA